MTRDEEIIEADVRGWLLNPGWILTGFLQVILIADGVNSISRALLAPRSAENLRERKIPSEYSIHRAAMKSDLIKADKLTARAFSPRRALEKLETANSPTLPLADLLDGCTRTWIGKDAHAIITPLDDGRQIAFVSHPARLWGTDAGLGRRWESAVQRVDRHFLPTHSLSLIAKQLERPA